MNKASKLLWVLLSLAMAVFMLGCPTDGGGGDDDEKLNPAQITNEWQTFYIKSVDAKRPAGMTNLRGVQRWHFHADEALIAEGGKFGVQIQKIFVSNSTETNSATGMPSDATVVVDFTLGDDEEDWAVNTYDNAMTEWTIANGAASISLTTEQIEAGLKNGNMYLGNISCNSNNAVDALFWGFVLKTAGDDVNAALLDMDPDGNELVATAKERLYFADWFKLDVKTDPIIEPPVVVEPPVPAVDDWTTVYAEIPANTDIMAFHSGNGSVQIQKFFVSTTKSETDAVVLYDFTKNPVEENSDIYDWGAGAGSDSFDSGVADGAYTLTASGTYAAGGRFGYPTFTEGSYVGFVIKSAGLGDVRFNFQDSTGKELKLYNFVDLLPQEWTTVYQLISATTDEISLHTNAGSVQLQKIFLSDTKSADNATVLFDFTATPVTVHESLSGDGVNTVLSHVADGVFDITSTGDYVAGGYFGSDVLAKEQYLGFVVKIPANIAFGNNSARFVHREQVNNKPKNHEVRFENILIGMKPEEPEEPEEPGEPVFADAWKTVYYEIVNTATAADLHNSNGGGRIQKIFLNDSKSETGATQLIDFSTATVTNNEDAVTNYIDAAAFVKDGAYEITSTGYMYGGKIELKEAAQGKFLGFVVKLAQPEDTNEFRFAMGNNEVHFKNMAIAE